MSQAIDSQNFAVTHRPRLAEITEHPQLDFADYERRLASLQGALQRIQQAYLRTSERALIVLEGWDTAGKGGLVRRLGWALDPRSFEVHPIAAPDEHERGYSRFCQARKYLDSAIAIAARHWRSDQRRGRSGSDQHRATSLDRRPPIISRMRHQWTCRDIVRLQYTPPAFEDASDVLSNPSFVSEKEPWTRTESPDRRRRSRAQSRRWSR